MHLTMVGTGYVGLVTGACFAETGNHVTCLDVDAGKIEKLRNGVSPIYEPGLEELLERNIAAGRLRFTTDRWEAYRDAEVIFICVGTPPGEDGSADLKYVLQAAAEIAEAIERLGPNQKPKLVVVKSTVPVGSSHAVRDAIRARTGHPFHIGDNPEFLKEGDAINDFMKPDRVVCGVEDEHAAERMRELYEPFVRQGNPIFVMDVRSAEMVKYASNAMLACKISFINEIAGLCERYGANVTSVREGMCADRRIGNQFLYPGLGYGGSCFPKDTQAVVMMGRAARYECSLNAAVHEVNQRQRTHFWAKVVGRLGADLRGRTLAFWGVAFKPRTDDIREAPSLTLMHMALAAGAAVRAYDPVALENLAAEMPAVERGEDLYGILDGADGLIICTEWNEFRSPDFDEIARRLRGRVIFDGRNLYKPHVPAEHGLEYHSVGRAPALPTA
ncbi:MAG TPA: UDP-glucose/GDP-mannose dehydrogenase family protein [Phycisphaerales bacterium]|nr:UDP-glucose/GDP-mannose dehydrogenase family protein [Phycisphaerales bacterium]HMP38452.1 UDP-glucose/GDP-mannose dehydrogenase family protein [Phycisphaerales bacterium]